MKAVSEANKFTVATSPDHYLGFCGVARAGKRLVCAYLQTDQHLRTTTEVMTAISDDGGRTWNSHRSLAHLDCRNDGAIWLSPEINSLGDGRLALLCDRAERTVNQEHVSLYRWQKAERGMSNYLFISEDAGQKWSQPRKIDAIGGEPERLHRLSNGLLLYSCTVSGDRRKPQSQKEIQATLEPQAYYKNMLMASHDNGKTFAPYATLADDEYYSDCEVGLVEFAPGQLLAISRCGDGGGRFGQCSRVRRSSDYGRSWSDPVLVPIYAQRPIPGKLLSDRLLVSWRNYSGTIASCVGILDPEHLPAYEPGCFLRDESRCRMENGIMVMETGEGIGDAATYHFYPAQDDDTEITIEAEMQLEAEDICGCVITAGVRVRLLPGRVEMEDGTGFEMDTSLFHRYHINRKNGRLTIRIDDILKLDCDCRKSAVRNVAFGNRAFTHDEYLRLPETDPRAEFASVHFIRNRSLSRWKSLRVKVSNSCDHAIDWHWNSKNGYLDPYRRENTIILDYNDSFSHADNGYSGWSQLPDGTIVVCDYTRGSPAATKPFIRAYRLAEEDL